MSDRETIFKAIQSALEPLPERTAYPEWETDLSVSRHGRGDADDLELFAQRLKAAKGVFFESWQALAGFLREQNASAGYIDEALRGEAGQALDGLSLETAIDRERIDDYAFGITLASGAIAESGTIILRDGDSPYRLAALAPWIHVAVVRKEAIHRTVADAVAAFGGDPSIIFATGPSKTADIEGILIQGVHGPGVQAVLVV